MTVNNKTITTTGIGSSLVTTQAKLTAMPTQGSYDVSGALRVTLNGPGTGMYAADGSLRVTNAPGTGIMDGSGALRIGAAGALTGVFSNAPNINDSPATIDGFTGAMAPNGAIRMKGALT